MLPTNMSQTLSRRESAVMKWLATGKTAFETAQILGISPKTVETHRSRLYAKLDITSRAQLVEMAIALRVIESVDAEMQSAGSGMEKLRNRYHEALASDRSGTLAYLSSELVATRATCDAYKAHAANLEALLLEAQAA